MKEKWIEVESSAVKALRFHNQEGWLDVRLHTGKEYRYSNIQFEEYSRVLTGGPSGSVGKEFNNLKFRHEGEVTELGATL